MTVEIIHRYWCLCVMDESNIDFSSNTMALFGRLSSSIVFKNSKLETLEIAYQ